ncbi:MAG TPA: hypothetical protein VFF73_08290 [Planctomycetota bacterium]|nr:hypothetical protein [Planctomycetota bacterium]
MATEFKTIDNIKESVGFVKSNLVPCAVAGICMGIPIVGASVMVNYLRKKKEGSLQIGDLFNFENLVGNFLASLSFLGFMCCFVPGALLSFTMPIMADKPGTEWLNAIKASLAFGKKNLVPMCIMILICGLVTAAPMIAMAIITTIGGMIMSILGMILGLVSLLVLLVVVMVGNPIVIGAIWNCYNGAKADVAAAAAEAGVTLA